MNQLIELLELPADTTPEALLVFVGGLKQEHAAQAATLATRRDRAQIPLTAELRQRLTESRAWLLGITDAVMRRQGELEAEITPLETTGRELAMEALRLDGEIIRDTQAAVQLAAVNTRREKITSRVAELREELDRISPPSLLEVSGVMDAIISHWSEQLPAVVQNHLGNFDPDPNKIAQIAKMFSAFAHLRGLRALSYERGATLKPANIQRVVAILNRALRGQPMLLVDAD